MKLLIKIFGIITIGGVFAGAKDHIDNKRVGRKANTIYEDCVKRGLDFFFGISAVVLFWPVYLTIAILVKVKLGHPVLYRTQRAGRINIVTGKEEIFELIKFRSMSNETDNEGNLLPDTKRLTKFGRILRASSIDELPEIVNIIKGEMSLIGPRPLPPVYLPYYTKEERKRHDIRPGLSGLAQINGRNSIEWEEKFKYDVEYAESITLKKDIDIIFMTIKKVINHSDIGQGEEHPGDFDEHRKNQILKEGSEL